MSPWLDQLLIALIVIASAAYAIYSLGPKALRAKIRKHIFGREDAESATGCGGCSDCGPGTQKSEIKISLASVRKELKDPN
jgi:hypothetical protein